MYKIVFSQIETLNGVRTKEEAHEYPHQFRLKRKAVCYVRESIQNDFIKEGYETELTAKGGIICFKSEITAKGNRTVEFTIKIKKA